MSGALQTLRNLQVSVMTVKFCQAFYYFVVAVVRLVIHAGIIYLHYWAGRTLRNEFANTLEDVVNIILKVRYGSCC